MSNEELKALKASINKAQMARTIKGLKWRSGVGR